MRIHRKYISLALLLMFAAASSSCVFDELEPCGEPVTRAGAGLSFVIALDNADGNQIGSWTNHYEADGEGYENYIQLFGKDRGLLVMLFNSEGKFRYQIQISYTGVKSVPGGYQIDLSEATILKDPHGEDIMKMLKTEAFKVAVMANWPLEQISNGDTFKYGDDIGKLSHFYADAQFQIEDQVGIYQHVLKGNAASGYFSSCNTYWVEDYTDQHGETKDRYMDRIKTGYWRYYYSNINEYIKRGSGDSKGAYFTADSKNHKIDFHRRVDELNEFEVKEVWRNWDFSGGKNLDAYRVSKNSAELSSFASVMQGWNAEFVKKYMTGAVSGGAYTITNGSHIDHDGLIFYAGTNNRARYMPYNASTGEGGYVEFVTNSRLPADQNNSTPPSKAASDKAIRITDIYTGAQSDKVPQAAGLAFNIPCDVTVRVKASSPDGAKLYMSWSDQSNTSTSGTSARYDFWFVSGFTPEKKHVANDPEARAVGTTPEYFSLTMNPSNQLFFPIFIFGEYGKTLRIHEIEFVKDVHLYDVDSVTKTPGEDNPIPMYGIQDFDAIGEDNYNKTPNGETFPLSSACEWADYDYKQVHILRSVAKVEIYFPRSVFEHHKPTHIYMRSMNSRANCETMDVRTPTDLLWYGEESPVFKKDEVINTYESVRGKYTNHAGQAFLRDRGIDDELDDILDYCPIHGQSGTYTNLLSWFYGCWRDWGWNWNGSSVTVPAGNTPRIFNPRIEGYSNNNYVRFLEVDEPTGQYYKYICYSPEQFSDNTDIDGSLSSRAKVQHVELHFGGPQDNLDDNYAYRLYFTDYSSTGGKSIAGTKREKYDDDIEKEPAYLNYISPILRNHVYRFYVTSFNPDQSVNVRLTVSAPTNRNASITIN